MLIVDVLHAIQLILKNFITLISHLLIKDILSLMIDIG
jgi:hypothetical protein